MTLWQFWLGLVVSSGLLGGILKACWKLVRVGSDVLGKLEDHERRIGRIENHLDPHGSWLREAR